MLKEHYTTLNDVMREEMRIASANVYDMPEIFHVSFEKHRDVKLFAKEVAGFLKGAQRAVMISGLTSQGVDPE
jgi:hypothetical protein